MDANPTNSAQMFKIAYISCFYNLCDFVVPKKNCEIFLKQTLSQLPQKDVYFCNLQIADHKNSILAESILPKQSITLKSNSILWHKERCQNILISKFNLLANYDYVMWLDTDIIFEKLPHPFFFSIDHKWDMFQPFSHSYRPDEKNFDDINNKSSLFKKDYEQECWVKTKFKGGDIGLSWAISTKLLKKLGCFFDYGIIGGGDSFFVMPMVNQSIKTKCVGFDNSLKDYHLAHLKPKLGYLNNRVYHMYHGSSTNRRYMNRHTILQKHNFNPKTDLTTDKNGLYTIQGKPELYKDIKNYFISRREDS